MIYPKKDKSRLWLPLVLFLAFCSLPAQGGPSCLKELKSLLSRNDFQTARSLSDYERMLGKTFETTLDRLPQNARVIDLGGGDGTAAKTISRTDRDTVLVAYSAISRASSTETLTALYGRFFEDIPNSELLSKGPFRLGIDVWGVAAYTNRISEAFQKIHEILSKGGHYFMVVGPKRPGVKISLFSGTQIGIDSSMYSSEVILRDGTQMPLPDYIKRKMKGFNIREVAGSAYAFHFRKNGDAFSFPRLKYLGTPSDGKLYPLFKVFPDPHQMPPARLFIEVEP